MKKSLLVAATLALCASALAQSPGQYQCMPKPFGDGTGVTTYDDGQLYMAGWYCGDGYGWNLNYAVATHEWLTPDRLLRMGTVSTSDGFAKFWSDNVTSVMTAEKIGVLSAHMPAAPPSPKWYVATNGGTPTRPVYPLIGGERVTSSIERADVGAECTCSPASNRSVEGKSTYCMVRRTVDGTTLVALCKSSS